MTLAIAHKSTGVIPYVILQYEELKSKIRNLLRNFLVHYAALTIKRTINNITLLMALHHTQDGFLYFFRCYNDSTLSWHTSLPTLNLPVKSHLSLG